MRTNITLDDELYAQAKQLAARTGRTLSRIIEDALREMMARKDGVFAGVSARLRTVSGSGLQSGVDLHDSASLLDLMDQFEGPDQYQHGEERFRK